MTNNNHKSGHIAKSFICGALLTAVLSLLLTLKYASSSQTAAVILSDALFISGVIYLVLFILRQVTKNAFFGFHSYILYRLTAVRTRSEIKYKSYAAYSEARKKEKPVTKGMGNLSGRTDPRASNKGNGYWYDGTENRNEGAAASHTDPAASPGDTASISAAVFWLPGLSFIILSILIAALR